jgi:two-component system, OmpR family, alkaline phosphatase synthesis response regulator PhoP
LLPGIGGTAGPAWAVVPEESPRSPNDKRSGLGDDGSAPVSQGVREGSAIATVLVLDKDPLQLELAAVLLKRDSHKAITTAEPETALDALRNQAVDLVVIDTSLPRHDGYRLGQQIRQMKPQVPVVVVSDCNDDDFIVRSLLAFADEYVIKPYSPRQLLARIYALLRRTGATHVNRNADGTIVIGNLSLNLHQMQVNVGATRVALTPREISLLSALMMNPNRVLARSQLVRLAWGDDFEGCQKTVDVCIQRLRKKIQPHLVGPDYIEAVRGFGYKLQRPESRADARAMKTSVVAAAQSA